VSPPSPTFEASGPDGGRSLQSSGSQRPFRFSLQASDAGSRQEWVDLVKRADDAGFDALVTADHLGGSMAPLLPLVTAAEVSDRLRLGVMVLNNDFHHPALLARDIATVDLLSDGRVEVGLGAGHSEPEYRAAGLPFDPARVRVDRLAESVPLLRRLLDGETVTFTGNHYQLTDERCDPASVQAHVPILVGGGGRRVQALAARHADAVGFTGLGRTLVDGQRHEPSGFSPRAVDADVAAFVAAARGRAGIVERQVLVQAVRVTNDAQAAARQLIDAFLPTLSEEDVLASPYLMIGTVGSLVDQLLQRRARWGFTHYTVRPDALGALEPVMAALRDR
jgi:probable F420-dependent oxidoreductase